MLILCQAPIIPLARQLYKAYQTSPAASKLNFYIRSNALDAILAPEIGLIMTAINQAVTKQDRNGTKHNARPAYVR